MTKIGHSQWKSFSVALLAKGGQVCWENDFQTRRLAAAACMIR
jgi:hypothetical protein